MVISRETLWETGHDETVEVNQRALIDKVLARYSGEFTVFRELLQNSDDARSKAVEIHFETEAYTRNPSQSIESNSLRQPPSLKTIHVSQWTFKNNGNIFREEDWQRLKKIAEGNPDEEKIGAFGVGFYSLFSVTEEPFVTSGAYIRIDQWMGFYWKDKRDQLYARRGQLPDTEEPSDRSWTTFTMPLRESAPMPTAFDFTRFLASSITFMTHLSEVSVYFDEKHLVKLTKSSGIPRSLGLPKALNNLSSMGIMAIDDIHSTSLHIQARVMKWIYTSGTEKKRPTPVVKPNTSGGIGVGFFASLFSSRSGHSTPQKPENPIAQVVEAPSDLFAVNDTSVSLTIYSASINVRLEKKVATEIQRATKKNPPTRMKFELIYTAKDEYDASQEEERRQPVTTGSIFQGLRADLEGTGAGRIFIGHSTIQTTGLGGHMAGRFIPTVERESIDFMDRNVAIWNKELLFVAGFLARSAYEFELDNIRNQWEGLKSDSSDPSPDMQARLTSQVVHALKFFMFHTSTPSPDVSNLIEAAFFSSSLKEGITILSTKGVRNTNDVRIPDPAFSGFIRNLPVLSEDMMAGARPIITVLQSRGLIKEITFKDVLDELRSRPLSEAEFIACLNWWICVYQGNIERSSTIRAQLIDAVILANDIDGHRNQTIIPLNTIRCFLNPKVSSGCILPDGPLPAYLLPVKISKAFKPEALSTAFPWTEFTVVQWVAFLSDQAPGSCPIAFDIDQSPEWAERVLTSLARVWPSQPTQAKERIRELLQGKTCIPTSGGMRKPTQSYFSNVNVFHDLPIIALPSGVIVKGTLERFLQDLGVRKHVDLQIVFNRMIKTNEWTITDLTKYLVSVKSTLTAEELERLKATVAFPKEASEPSNYAETSATTKRTRYRARDLYEPLDVFRVLKLPLIDWGKQTKWRSSSDEAKLLFELGLRRFPPLEILIPLCATDDPAIRPVALNYLLDNINSRYTDYDPVNFRDIPFIPALRENQACMATIQEVFVRAEWATMGFLILHPSQRANAAKLKVMEAPPVLQLVKRLESNPPQDLSEATAWFSLLSTRVNDFTDSHLHHLKSLAFVPITSEKGGVGPTMNRLSPSQCYLGGGKDERFHSKLFVFVDFGLAANSFLSACGARQQPSVEEVVKILLADPHTFYNLAQGPNSFLAELRNIAVNVKTISPTTIARMKRSPILLGSQRRAKQERKNPDDVDEDEWDILYDLKKPDQIVIADDTQAYQAFGDELYTAPQEDILEGFYSLLGSRRISEVVREQHETTSEILKSKVAVEIRTLILERLPLFLHEHTHTQTRVSCSWLSAADHFVVKTFGKITVIKTLNHGALRASRKQEASAVSKRLSSGQIQLWIAGNSQIDMYEVAMSLNRLLFDAPKTNDALLFMTILSTDLRSLKRRGYNVDRILSQQSKARQSAENARLKEEHARLVSQQSQNQNEKMLPSQPSNAASTDFPPQLQSAPDDVKQQSNSLINSFHNLRRKVVGNDSPFNAFSPSQTTVNPPANEALVPSSHSQLSTDRRKPLTGGTDVTPLNHISNNIEVAINSCRSESGGLLQNRERMERVKETLDEGYCDISGRAGNLHHIGQMGSVMVYLSDESSAAQRQNFMTTHRMSIARFIHIMKLLAEIYQLPLSNLHIFYDFEGELIAFNRNGSIFLNLRYYEGWHDADVSTGIEDQAYISWYFTLAHEIAHNLVQPHNSEHEFYMSAICEKYLLDLARILNTK